MLPNCDPKVVVALVPYVRGRRPTCGWVPRGSRGSFVCFLTFVVELWVHVDRGFPMTEVGVGPVGQPRVPTHPVGVRASCPGGPDPVRSR